MEYIAFLFYVFGGRAILNFNIICHCLRKKYILNNDMFQDRILISLWPCASVVNQPSLCFLSLSTIAISTIFLTDPYRACAYLQKFTSTRNTTKSTVPPIMLVILHNQYYVSTGQLGVRIDRGILCMWRAQQLD